MFRLDFSCKDCNFVRLNQVVNHINEAWNCMESDFHFDEDKFLELHGYNCDLVGVDLIIYWNGHNTLEIQNCIDFNCQEEQKLIAIIDFPEYRDEGYQDIDTYPLIAPEGYIWKRINTGNFRVLERYSVCTWTTSFIAVDDNSELYEGNSLKEI